MTDHETPPRRCANETCPREAEASERYCAECGLERSLFLRERRDLPDSTRTDGWEREPGR